MRYFTLVVALFACFALLSCGSKSKRPDGGIVIAAFSGDVHFEYNSAKVTPSGRAELQKILSGHVNIPEGNHILVEGHTCDTGTPAYNLKLSQERADAVAKILIEMGFDKTRVAAKGLGQDDPEFPNDTEENKAKNRRVDVVLVPDVQE